MKKSGFLLAIIMVLCTLFMITACGNNEQNLRINVPDEVIQAELGSYDLPKYDVVDENNLIIAGYLVEVIGVKDPDGEDVQVVYSKINATKTGIYEITYGAGEGIPQAVLRVDFADRTAPSVEMEENAIPEFYIDGFTYELPQYSIVNGPDLSKCWIKVYYQANSDSERVEVAVENSRFDVEYNNGTYIIVIHAEDAAGNAKDYEYEVDAIGPSEVVSGKILYFDEEFGISQVKTLWNNFKISYTDEMAYGEEAGSAKVVGNGGTDYIILDRLIESDVSDYTHLVIYIYNDNDYPIYTGYCWFGDTTLEPHAWTEFKIPVSDLDVQNVTHPSIAGITITSKNITNLSLRLFSDYTTNQLPADSTFYLSAMYAITEETSEPDTIVPDKIAYFDEEFGLSQVSVYWPAEHKISFDTSIKHGEEKGSLKVDIVKPQDNYILLNSPYIKDVSAYDSIIFYVYNPTDTAFKMGTNWAADTEIVPGGWTKVSISTSLFAEAKISNMAGNTLEATDISGLPLRIFSADDMSAGDCFYISAMYGEKAEVSERENLILNFDEQSGLDRVSLYWNDVHKISFDATTAYEGESGSLKVEIINPQDNYILLNIPNIKDVSAYDYIAFRVYNSADTAFKMGTTWAADTEIVPGQWTEVKIPVSLFADGSITDMNGTVLAATDITGLPLRIFSADAMSAGDCFYISAMYGFIS